MRSFCSLILISFLSPPVLCLYDIYILYISEEPSPSDANPHGLNFQMIQAPANVVEYQGLEEDGCADWAWKNNISFFGFRPLRCFDSEGIIISYPFFSRLFS